MNEEETAKLIDKLKCPCDTVKNQGEEVKATREIMIEIKADLKHLTALTEENRDDIKDIKENAVTLEQFKQLEKRVADLESVPKNRWDSIVKEAISAVAGGLIAFALMKLGMGG